MPNLRFQAKKQEKTVNFKENKKALLKSAV